MPSMTEHRQARARLALTGPPPIGKGSGLGLPLVGLSFDKPRKARQGNRRAFTLIELLVVVAIIAVLLSLLTPSMRWAVEGARRAVCVNNLHTLATALQVYASTWEEFPCHAYNTQPWHGDPEYANFPYYWADQVALITGAMGCRTAEPANWWNAPQRYHTVGGVFDRVLLAAGSPTSAQFLASGFSNSNLPPTNPEFRKTEFWCPSSDPDQEWNCNGGASGYVKNERTRYVSSYAYNQAVGFDLNYPDRRRWLAPMLQNVSQLALLGCGGGRVHGGTRIIDNSQRSAGIWHGDTDSNMAFVDGHVAPLEVYCRDGSPGDPGRVRYGVGFRFDIEVQVLPGGD